MCENKERGQGLLTVFQNYEILFINKMSLKILTHKATDDRLHIFKATIEIHMHVHCVPLWRYPVSDNS